MRCTKAREVIVLEESGDATPRERRRMTSHIAGCEECRRFATAGPLLLGALRTLQPLRDADFAAIRARVLADVAAPRRLVWPLRLAAAAAIVVVAVFLVLDRTEAPTQTAAVKPPEVRQPIRAAAVPPAPHRRPAEEAHAPARRPRQAVETAAGQPSEMRILITTADPDIRIIWIVNPTPPKEES